jgi:hypothetical protein
MDPPNLRGTNSERAEEKRAPRWRYMAYRAMREVAKGRTPMTALRRSPRGWP